MSDRGTKYIRTCVSAVTMLLFALLVTVAPGFAASGQTYGGQAKVIQADLLDDTLDVTLVDTGQLPASGGALHGHLLRASASGLLTAETLHAAVIGHNGATRAESSVAEVDLNVAGNRITVDFLMARASAECNGSRATIAATTQVAGLSVNGRQVNVSGAPNQRVNVGPVKLIINEQSGFAGRRGGVMRVNALHVLVDDVLGTQIADVTISSAEAGIRCRSNTPPPSGDDFITGGGWITGTPDGSRANFGVAGGVKNGSLWGHLTYIDHGSGLKVKGKTITGYTVIDETTRQIDGTAMADGVAVTFTVIVSDNGEPGRSDTFALTLSNGYSASGNLQGGNIQLHK